MAEDISQERTERPSPKRLQEARERGQVPRSRELNTTILMVSAAAGVLLLGPRAVAGLSAMMRTALSLNRGHLLDTGVVMQDFSQAVTTVLIALGPFLLLLVLTALLAPLALGGWSFSAKALSFQWHKLNPIQGLQRMFAWRGVVELAKSLAKFALLGLATVLLLRQQAAGLLNLSGEPLPQALAHTGQLIAWSFFIISLTLIAIAAVDVPFQLWEYARQLKMTRQELRDELRDTDGKPEVKAQIRKLQRQMAHARMMTQVPKADVIITNPAHVAVALRYDQSRMRAPRVVAKGAELIAAQIRYVGSQHKVPMLSAPPLARALYYSTKLNHEIPIGLYLAVAQVLAYVYQLRNYSGEAGPPPDITVPEELRRD